MSKLKKLIDKNNVEEDAADLVAVTLDIARIHLNMLASKAKDGTLNAQESFALCSYLKTLSYVEKTQKDTKKDFAKSVTKMSEKELQDELRKYSTQIMGVLDDSDENDA